MFHIEQSESDNIYNMPTLHNHDDYELYFLLSGSKNYLSTRSMCKLSPNSLIVIEPYLLHKFEGGPYVRVLINLNPKCLSPYQIELLNMLSKQEHFNFNDNQMKQIKKTLDSLLNIYNSPVSNKEIKFFLYLGLLFMQIYKFSSKIKQSVSIINQDIPPFTTPIVLKVIDYIKTHYNEKITLKELCDKFTISKAWLSKCFLEATNLSIIEYKLNLQISEAKKLLIKTRLSLDEIAKITGFSSTAYFGIMFKKIVTIPPSQFRNHIRSQKTKTSKK